MYKFTTTGLVHLSKALHAMSYRYQEDISSSDIPVGMHNILLENITRQNWFHYLHKTSNNEHEWTPVKHLNVLHLSRTQKQFRQ